MRVIKKGSLIFLLIFVLFLGFIGGTLLGRHSPSASVVLNDQLLIETNPNQVVHNNATGKININTASSALLQSLPNIGPTLAQRIIDYRCENGDFSCIEDLMNIKGIGEAKLNDIRPYITVGG